MDQGGVEIFLVVSCKRNADELRMQTLPTEYLDNHKTKIVIKSKLAECGPRQKGSRSTFSS